MTNQTYKLVVHVPADGAELETIEDRYFGPLAEVLSRVCWPWLDGDSFAVYQRQPDHSWLLYYQAI